MSEQPKLHREVKASVKVGLNSKDPNAERRSAVTFSRSSSKYTERKHTQLYTRLPILAYFKYMSLIFIVHLCMCIQPFTGLGFREVKQNGIQAKTQMSVHPCTHTHLRCLHTWSDCSTTLYSFGFLSSVRCMCLVVCYKLWQWVSNLAVTNPLLMFDRVTAKLKFLRTFRNMKVTITTDKESHTYWINDLTSARIQKKIQ